MRRTPSGKNLALGARDLAIFQVLQRYRYLRSTYIHAFVGGASETRFKERLGDLFHEGYLDRPEQQWRFADARCYPVVYELDQQGELMLSRGATTDSVPATYLSRHAHRQFEHAVSICEVVASIELAVQERLDLRFIPWGEISGRAPASTQAAAVPSRIPVGDSAVVPDAIFGLEYRADDRKAYRFFALEIDRGTMPVVRSNARQTSYLAKLEAYREVIASRAQKTHLGVSSLLVLTATTRDRHLAEMLRSVSDWDATQTFLFKAIIPSELRSPQAHLLSMPWVRAGSTPLAIDE